MFDFDLPNERIARHPPERRDGGRLLVLDRAEPIQHGQVTDLPQLLEAGDLLCAVNRVPRAALLADELGPGPADLASTVGVERLVTTALESLDGYPLVAREGRHRVVAHALSDLEHGLRARRFAEEDVAALDAAWRRLTKADDGG